ncbi:Aste57867_22100 [Aphanomyces stellatus]|uniref:Aste57867_22100 protein n=1 Tax=Aphanomyces stellatus TaxID=120398 RepID=A0A485LJB6_9STRA|nr:hypothetical protein As57867_022031 [Aphanomyces stellatus]VFT98768.1 Aste57867_22100 [Aphanomyces stellatus]
MQTLVVAAAALLAASASAAKDIKFKWYACPFQTAEDKAHDDPDATPAECADVKMPLCFPGVCDSTKEINVFVKRLLATSVPVDKKPRAMWMIQGGPGFGSPGLEPGLLDAYNAFNGTLSVYTIDHRGTGRSTILTCKSDDELDNWQNLANCHGDLKAQYGDVAPQGFSVTSAASDIAAVVQTSLFDNVDVIVYGVSYGTYVVERLMHLAPSNVKGYVLDSVQSEEFGVTKAAPYYSNWDRDVGDAVDQYFAYCDKDPFCAARIGPNSKKTLLDVYQALNATTSPCYRVLAAKAADKGIATPVEYVASNLYSLLGSKDQWSLIAPYIYRLHRCSQPDIDMFANITSPRVGAFSDDGTRAGGSPSNAYLKEEGYSVVLYNNIVYNELWELPSPTKTLMAAQSTAALFGSKDTNGLNDLFKEFCIYRNNTDPVCRGYKQYGGGGFMYPRDVYWNHSANVPSNASVLVLSGLMDLATPPKYATDQYNTMQGTAKMLLQFPYGGHGTLSTAPLADQPDVDCANLIFYQYIRNRGNLAGLDTTCIAKVQTLDFKNITATDKALKIFGTADDVWGPIAPPLPPVPPTPTTRSPDVPTPSSARALGSALLAFVVAMSLS